MNQQEIANTVGILKENVPVLVNSSVKTASAMVGLGCHYLGLLLDKTAKVANKVERRMIS